jgi:adenine-specific DNA-methyltransferase
VIRADPSPEKRRGAYYTPRPLAAFLAQWAIRSPFDRVLDPACGEAVFLDVAAARLRSLGAERLDDLITGYELDPLAAAEASRTLPEAAIVQRSFFDVESTGVPYHAVIGNPPYIRYHYFNGHMRASALQRAKSEGVTLSRLASSWAPFLVHATTFLSEAGRLAFVLPAELLSTDYALPIRKFLRERFAAVDVLTFEERIFPGALVDAVLVLAEGRGPGRVAVHRLEHSGALATFDRWGSAPTSAVKWTHALLDPRAADAFKAATACWRRLGDVAAVDIGLVTGANDFFLLTDAEAAARRLQRRDLRRAIARGQQVKGYAVTDADWDELRWRGETVWLFNPERATGMAGAYILEGEAEKVHLSYKCSIRTPWWRLRVLEPPDLILSYMSNHSPRLVVNDARAQTTNLLHNVRLSCGDIDAHILALSWMNSATMLSCELEGRTYGGGVLKLETREAENVLIPDISSHDARQLAERAAEIDSLVRSGRMDTVADLVDPIVLGGLSAERRATVRAGWFDLRERRRRRANASKAGVDGQGSKDA